MESRMNAILEDIRRNSSRSDEEEKMIDCCREKGASNWLTTLPIADKGFALSKQEFRDAILLRYNLEINNLPNICPCGDNFSVNHAMMCKRGGFVTLRHNEIRDITSEMLKEVCHDVRSEPTITPLTGGNFGHRTSNNSDEAKLDISARSFWVRGQRAFFDVRVSTPSLFPTDTRAYRQSIVNMKMKNEEHTMNESCKSKWEASPHWSSRHLAEYHPILNVRNSTADSQSCLLNADHCQKVP